MSKIIFWEAGEWNIPIDDCNGELTTKEDASRFIRVLEAEIVESEYLKLKSALDSIYTTAIKAGLMHNKDHLILLVSIMDQCTKALGKKSVEDTAKEHRSTTILACHMKTGGGPNGKVTRIHSDDDGGNL